MQDGDLSELYKRTKAELSPQSPVLELLSELVVGSLRLLWTVGDVPSEDAERLAQLLGQRKLPPLGVLRGAARELARLPGDSAVRALVLALTELHASLAVEVAGAAFTDQANKLRGQVVAQLFRVPPVGPTDESAQREGAQNAPELLRALAPFILLTFALTILNNFGVFGETTAHSPMATVQVVRKPVGTPPGDAAHVTGEAAAESPSGRSDAVPAAHSSQYPGGPGDDVSASHHKHGGHRAAALTSQTPSEFTSVDVRTLERRLYPPFDASLFRAVVEEVGAVPTVVTAAERIIRLDQSDDEDDVGGATRPQAAQSSTFTHEELEQRTEVLRRYYEAIDKRSGTTATSA